jgi:hypothetical protein
MYLQKRKYSFTTSLKLYKPHIYDTHSKIGAIMESKSISFAFNLCPD